SLRRSARPASGASGLAPAAENETAQREAEPERAGGEAADRDPLAPRRQPLPPAERLLLLRRQRLAAAPLAQRTAGAHAEIEVVEDLLVRHARHCSLLRRCRRASSTCRTCTSARGGRTTTWPRARASRRSPSGWARSSLSPPATSRISGSPGSTRRRPGSCAVWSGRCSSC